MATWDHDDLLPKGKGGVHDISDDIGTNDNYSEAISNLRFKLLLEKKSQSNMWDFLELCHKYSVDLSLMGKVAQTLVFKKHSDKNFDFVDYMEKKGLKITLPSTETNPSGAAGTSTSGEGSKKLKGKALVKKLNVVTPKKLGTAEAPKKSTTGTDEAPKKSTTRSAEAPRKSTGTVEAPKLKKGPTREVLNPNKKGTPGVTPELQLISGTSADTTGQKTKTVKFIRPTKPQSTLPSNQVGSSSGRTSSTANAHGPDNTTSSPGQSVQPATVNPNGHSGDGGSVVDSGKKNLQVVEYNDESGDEDTSSKTKKRKVAVLEKKSGFQPDRHVVETDQVAADVKMQLDPKTKDQLKPEFDELRKWFPLGDKLVYASISQLTDPDATAVYRPCSIRHVAEIQNTMIGSADTPQPATVVPYELSATGKKNFLNILTMKELKAFIKKGGKFMETVQSSRLTRSRYEGNE
ncbi:hypothetical protein R1sor_002710 [Riccia sorocarpa]|uniref:Uncharacterized protein n=1 Tax=Riccia sorocarpa TaxID=122646 RepID=A0ABD3GZY4_9MARC